MSNRDKFLLVLIGIAGVILLPYFLYIKDTRDRITNLDNEIVQLTDRYNQLLEFEKNREFYVKGTEENNRIRDEIIAEFPADIKQSNYVMYLLNTEYSESNLFTNYDAESDDDIPENILVAVEPTIRFTEGQFAYNIQTPISSSSVDMGSVTTEGEDDIVAPIAEGQVVETEYVALQNNSNIKFTCYDHMAVNHLLEYIMEYQDPMIYRTISFKHDALTGRVTGEMMLAQYAVLGGEGREFSPLDIDPAIEERGNEDYGVFGPNEMLIRQEMKEEAEREAEEARNGIEADED